MYDERQLAERCAKGDRLACRELYDTFAGRLLALGARYTGSRESAEDVVQDALVKVFSSFQSFRYKGSGSLYAWMSRIVINRSLDWLRERKRSGTVNLDDAHADRTASVTESDVDTVPAEVLARMVEELPDGYRTVFNLYAMDGYSHKEIGKLLGIKEKSSSSQYFRARALLAEKIKEYIRNYEEI